jgi:signal transduction histidine kinase
MRERRGLPIAAHLGLLVALAFASAFVGIIAVIIFLPPRPPDVMRADEVAQHFQDGFRAAAARRPLPRDTMAWAIAAKPPSDAIGAPHMLPMQLDLARRLALRPEQIRIGALRITHSDVLVFRVREVGAHVGRLEEHIEVSGDHVYVRQAHAPDAAPEPDVRPGPDAPPLIVRIPPVPPGAAAPPATPLPPEPPRFAPAPPGVMLISGFEFAAQLPDHSWLVMRQGRNWAELGWIGGAALVIGAALAVLSLLALLFARRLARPIQSFAHAVEAVGVNPQSAPVLEEGPRELRGAARAVNAMQARLRTLIADRTKTLAAVAHDMRTPLMRLRLAAESAPPEQRERMAKEIGEVEALVASFIAFARDDPAEEPRVRLDLSALLQSLADDLGATGRSAAFEAPERIVVTGQSLGLKRLFSNLIDNGLKHGGNVQMMLRREGALAIVEIADDGPGVPADKRESIFEPFVRLGEGAGGAGVGLAAARSIARAHGGDIVILESEGGLRVQVRLPA